MVNCKKRGKKLLKLKVQKEGNLWKKRAIVKKGGNSKTRKKNTKNLLK